MSKTFLSFRVKYMIRSCAFVLCALLVMNGKISMAAAPTFVRHVVDTTICTQGTTGTVALDIRELLRYVDADGSDTFSVYSGPSVTSPSTSGTVGFLTIPSDPLVTGGLGEHVPAAGVFKFSYGSNSFGYRTFTIKISEGTSYDTVRVTVKLVTTPTVSVSGNYNSVHLGSSIALNGNFLADTFRYGNTFLQSWSSVAPAIASINPTSGVVTGIAVGTTTISYALHTPTCGTANTEYATYGVQVLTNIAPQLTTPPTPASLVPGQPYTISGSGFTAGGPYIVYFGAVRATVTSVTTTAINVMVPVSATYNNIQVLDSVSHLSTLMMHSAVPHHNNSGFITNTEADIYGSQPFLITPLPASSISGGPYSIDFADLNNDGKPDMIISGTRTPNIIVYPNTSTYGRVNESSFGSPLTFSIAASPISLRFADFDGDGKLDIVTASVGASALSIIRNISSGSTIDFAPRFELPVPGTLPGEVAIGDFDNDGRADIAAVLIGAADSGTFAGSGWSPSTLDEKVSKLVVAKNSYNRSSVVNLSASSFAMQVINTYDTTSAAISLAAGDLNNDKKADIVVSLHHKRKLDVYANTSAGGNISFAAPTSVSTAAGTGTLAACSACTPARPYDYTQYLTGYPEQVKIGDLDGDGKPDLAVAVTDSDLRTDNNYNIVRIFPNTSTSATITFGASTSLNTNSASPVALTLADFSGDGKLDIFASNSGGGEVSILKNSGTGFNFNTSVNKAVAGGNFAGLVSVAVADVDGNTIPDFAVVERAFNRVSMFRFYPRPDTTSIVGDSVVCFGGSTTLHSHTMTPASSATTGTWSVISDGTTNITIVGSATDTTVTINGTAAGIDTIKYTVTAFGDTNVVKYVVRVSAIASAGTITGPDSVCFGGSVTLTSTTPGGTWSISSGTAISITSGTGIATGVAASGSSVIQYTIAGCGTPSTKNMHIGLAANAGGTLDPTATTLCPTQTERVRLSPTASRGGVWAIRGAAGGLTQSAFATTDSISITGVTAGAYTVVYTYTNDCGTDSATVGITVNTTATQATISHTNDSVCVGSTVNLNITAGTTGGAWSVLSGPASVSSSTASSTVVTGTGLIGGTAIIRYAVSSGCGSPVTFDTITVSPNPGHVTISGPTRVCTSSTISLSVPTLPSGVAASWSAANGFSTVSSGTVTGVSTGVNTISYTQSNVCATIVDTKADTVSVAPTADVISGPTSICTGSTLSYSASSTLGAYDSRVWTSSAPSFATVAPLGANTANVTGVASGSTNITTTINGCSSVTSAPYTVVVDVPASTGNITGATHICSGSNTSLAYTGTGGSASSWSVTPGLTASGVSATNITITPAVVTSGFRVDTITYTTTSSCGTTTTLHVDTTFELPTAGVINGPATSPLVDSVCIGSSYSVNVLASSTISITSTAWTVADGTIAGVTGTGTTATVNGVAAGNTTITYTVNSAYCGSATATRPVKVKGLVSAGSLSGPSILCYNTSGLAVTTGTPGGSWTSADASKAIVGLSSGNLFGTYVVTPGNNPRGSVTITYTVSGFCNTATATYNQRVDAVPNASTITTSNPTGQPLLDSVCFGGNLTQIATPNATTLSAPTAGLTTTWSVVTGNLTTSSITTGSVVITGATPGIDTVVFRVANTCGADTAKRPIKILPPPAESHIVAPAFMCSGTTATFTGQLSTGETVPGTWGYLPGGTGTPGDNVFVGAFTGFASAGPAGTDRILFTPVAGYCGSDTSTWDVTVVLNPVAGTISGDTSLCVGASVSLTNFPGSGDYWYSSDTSIAKIDSFTGVMTGMSFGAATIYYSDTNFCGTATASQAVTVRALAEVGFIYGQDTSCVGGSFQLYDTVTAAAGGTWSATGGITITSTGVVTAVSPGLGVVTYTSNNDCGLNDTSYDIRVYGNPNMSSATAINRCDSAQLLYVATSDTVGTSFAWTRATVTGIANSAATGADTINEYLDNVDPAVPVTATYVFTLTAHGCTSNQNVAVTVSPTPTITSPLFDTICSGSQFIYLLTTNTAAANTTANWSRAAVAGVSPATNTGSGNINETLTGVPPLSYNVVYTYSLAWTGCPAHNEEVNLQIQPSPAAPQITTHSPSDVCTRTLDQNFGAATVPPTGVTYTWTATGAQVWATGNTRQYSLVNFTEPGDAVVYLLATISGYQCSAKDSFKVTVGNGISELPEVIYFNGDFVCLSNDQDSYQWGWDDRGSLDSAMFVNETNQNFRETDPDFTNKYYWVITTHNGCMQKSYFNPPTGVKNVTANMGEMKLYPNPTTNFVNVEINNTPGGKYNVEVVNLLGQKLDMSDLVNNKTTINVSDLANGVYFINCYRDGVKFASAKFVKN